MLKFFCQLKKNIKSCWKYGYNKKHYEKNTNKGKTVIFNIKHATQISCRNMAEILFMFCIDRNMFK